jgi:SAM-dependent methyltransferase
MDNIIEFKVESEISSNHWPYFECSGKNVLDLGCGRWGEHLHDEFSPIYFLRKGANKVVGIDASEDEINYYNNYYKDNKPSNLFFENIKIQSPEDVKKLIAKYDINAIKCDIEGYETVFYSLTEEDLKNIDVFCMEYHGDQIYNDFLNYFKKVNFRVIAHGKLWVDGFGALFAEKIKN